MEGIEGHRTTYEKNIEGDDKGGTEERRRDNEG